MRVYPSEDNLLSDPSSQDVGAFARSLSDGWRELCRSYLPIAPADSIWRFNRALVPADPEQGWKLHVSADLLSSYEVLRRVAPFLQSLGVLFKAPSSLQVLIRINCGLQYGYSQVGKFITVYPRNNAEALFLARQLHRLTSGLSAPAVPFDRQFRPGSCVYYRYGQFSPLILKNADGTTIRAIRNPQGELVPDLLEDIEAKPAWVSDPFIKSLRPQKVEVADSPLGKTIRVFRALSQRGKGGVYQALDLSDSLPRLCVLKEGRRRGETAWDGRDGNWRVRNEQRVLTALKDAGINVAQVRSSFELDGNYYLVTEFIEGENLWALLMRRQRRLRVAQVLRYGLQLSLIISRIHSAGWVWRDCKPSNLLVTKKGELRPLDFEGACPMDQPDPLSWSTPEFAAPEHDDLSPKQSRAPEDLYALGAVAYFMLTGRLPEASSPVTIKGLRRNAPSAVCDIVSRLLARDPEQRPHALTAANGFEAALSSVLS
jgi:hypothetical protein